MKQPEDVKFMHNALTVGQKVWVQTLQCNGKWVGDNGPITEAKIVKLTKTKFHVQGEGCGHNGGPCNLGKYNVDNLTQDNGKYGVDHKLFLHDPNLTSCSRLSCKKTMCDTCIRGVGHICHVCQAEFKGFLITRKILVPTNEAIIKQLRDFIKTEAGYYNNNDYPIADLDRIDDFFETSCEI